MSFICKLEYELSNRLVSANINLQNNDILHLQGQNGSGKTTLLHIISGLNNPKLGYIELNNKILFDNIQKINTPPQQRMIGLVAQDYVLFPNMKLMDNIKFAIKNNITSNKLLKEFIEIADLEKLLEHYPNQLSGGEKQKTSIIQSVINSPLLLLLDEPFSNIDPLCTEKIKNFLKSLQQQYNIPIIMTSHNDKDTENFTTCNLSL